MRCGRLVYPDRRSLTQPVFRGRTRKSFLCNSLYPNNLKNRRVSPDFFLRYHPILRSTLKCSSISCDCQRVFANRGPSDCHAWENDPSASHSDRRNSFFRESIDRFVPSPYDAVRFLSDLLVFGTPGEASGRENGKRGYRNITSERLVGQTLPSASFG